MTDEEALVRGICEEPESDAPRLVYADWLEERGQAERAEFIRLQIRFAEIQRVCSCGGCVKMRGGGQHTNGPCGIDRERVEVAGSKPVPLRLRLLHLWGYYPRSDGLMWQYKDCLGIPAIMGTHDLGSGLSGHPIAVVERGLISEIRCTLAEFMDQRCWGCEGSGRPFVPIQDVTGTIRHEHVRCNRCDGTGTLPGLARKLFGTHPITRVVLTDREPWDATTLASDHIGYRGVWRWLLKRPDRDAADQIPIEIYNEMLHLADRESLSYLEFDSLDSARAALSLSAANYARKLHGYTPLTSLVEAAE